MASVHIVHMCTKYCRLNVYTSYMYRVSYIHCICWLLPSNGSLYKQIVGYGRQVDHHRVG